MALCKHTLRLSTYVSKGSQHTGPAQPPPTQDQRKGTAALPPIKLALLSQAANRTLAEQGAQSCDVANAFLKA